MTWWHVTLVLVWGATTAYLGLRRNWLIYFLVGAAGFTLLAVYVFNAVGITAWISGQVGSHAAAVANFLGLPTRAFPDAPGTLMVMSRAPQPSWTILEVDMECSALLETLVFLGVALFFPGMGALRRVLSSVLGVLGIYVGNQLRLALIIGLLHLGGQHMVLFAHLVAGRLLFFVIVATIYWYVLTRFTLRQVRRNLQGGATWASER